VFLRKKSRRNSYIWKQIILVLKLVVDGSATGMWKSCNRFSYLCSYHFLCCFLSTVHVLPWPGYNLCVCDCQYQHCRWIGAGAFGKVYQAIDTKINCVVALKLTELEGDGNDGGVPAVSLREMSVLKEMDHENIIKYKCELLLLLLYDFLSFMVLVLLFKNPRSIFNLSLSFELMLFLIDFLGGTGCWMWCTKMARDWL